MSTPPITRELVRFAVGLQYEDIPADAVAKAKDCILDQLGVELIGFHPGLEQDSATVCGRHGWPGGEYHCQPRNQGTGLGRGFRQRNFRPGL